MTQNETRVSKPEAIKIGHRYVGFDLLRTLVFVAIFNYHYFYWVFYGPVSPYQGYPFHPLEVFLRTFYFGGQYILFLAILLISRSETFVQKALGTSAFCVAAWLIFCTVDAHDNDYFLTWDIHALLALGLLGSLLILKLNNEKVLLCIGLLLCALPSFVNLAPFVTSDFVKQILFGICERDMSDWPVFPWLGFVFLTFALGRYTTRSSFQARLAERPRLIEHLAFVISLLVFSIYLMPVLQSFPGGREWTCLTMGPINWHVIVAMVPFIFAVRYAMVRDYDVWMRNQKWARWVSQTTLNRSFGLFYAVHYPVIALWGEFLGAQYFSQWTTLLSLPFLWFVTLVISRWLREPYGRIVKVHSAYD